MLVDRKFLWINSKQKNQSLPKKSSSFPKNSHLDRNEFFMENFFFWETFFPLLLSLCSMTPCFYQ